LGGDPCVDLSTLGAANYTAPQGWIIDTSRGDAGTPGVHDEDQSATVRTNQYLSNYNIAIGQNTVQIEGKLCPGTGFSSYSPDFTHTYTVFLRSQNPINDPGDAQVTTPFLITSRSLCAAFRSEDQCVEPLSIEEEPAAFPVSIVDEPTLSLSADYLASAKLAITRQPAIKQLMRRLQSAMSNSYRSRTRRPVGETGFLESDYFKNQITKRLPDSLLNTHIGSMAGLSASAVEGLGGSTTLNQALQLDLSSFARRTGLSLPDAAKARRALLSSAVNRHAQTRDAR
jgi:hypothetical protein